jgi:hypothetical protein
MVQVAAAVVVVVVVVLAAAAALASVPTLSFSKKSLVMHCLQ